jgi:hypothetical protein
MEDVVTMRPEGQFWKMLTVRPKAKSSLNGFAYSPMSLSRVPSEILR